MKKKKDSLSDLTKRQREFYAKGRQICAMDAAYYEEKYNDALKQFQQYTQAHSSDKTGLLERKVSDLKCVTRKLSEVVSIMGAHLP